MNARLVAIGAFGVTFVAALSCGPVASECERDDQCDVGFRCDAASRLCVVDATTGDGGSVDALVLEGVTLPDAVQGQSWSFTLLASGGTPPYTWSFPNRPSSLSWLNLDTASGRLSGTPAELLPSTSFEVEVRDTAGERRTAAFVLSVRACTNGERVPCAGPTDGVCHVGEQVCENGALGACVTTGPSSRVDACGEDCSACDPKSADGCVGGACRCGGQAACAAGQTCCGGTCVDTNTSPDACGGCGSVCDTDRTHVERTCVQGTCDYPCADGWGRCPPNEGATSCVTDLMNDEAHCGACNSPCPQTALNATGVICDQGACKILGCKPDYADCDGMVGNGCERNLKTDPDYCGTCNTKCQTYPNSTRSCVNGQCGITCNANYGNCDPSLTNGCETDLRTSAAHCGACNNGCTGPANTVSHCSNKVCGWTCKANFANCNNSATDGCEANLLTSKSHCGTCGKVCDECSNGVCGERCASTLVCWYPDGCSTCPHPTNPGVSLPCCG